jgi:hypothetical protein
MTLSADEVAANLLAVGVGVAPAGPAAPGPGGDGDGDGGGGGGPGMTEAVPPRDPVPLRAPPVAFHEAPVGTGVAVAPAGTVKVLLQPMKRTELVMGGPSGVACPSSAVKVEVAVASGRSEKGSSVVLVVVGRGEGDVPGLVGADDEAEVTVEEEEEEEEEEVSGCGICIPIPRAGPLDVESLLGRMVGRCFQSDSHEVLGSLPPSVPWIQGMPGYTFDG